MSATEKARMVAHTQVRSRTACQPSASSRPTLARCAGPPRSRARTRHSSSAETTKVAASRAKAAAPPTPRTRAVASAGPTISATSRLTPVSACADWICSSSTVCGTSPVYAGRKNASAVPKSRPITTMCHTRTAPVMMSTARVPCSTARTTSLTTITRWRGSRSATTPPSSTSSTSGREYATSTRPTSDGSPVSRVTNSPTATSTRASPMTLAVWLSQSSRKSRADRTDSTAPP